MSKNVVGFTNKMSNAEQESEFIIPYFLENTFPKIKNENMVVALVTEGERPVKIAKENNTKIMIMFNSR